MSSDPRLRVGVLGASGYAGTELLRLCASHPVFDVVFAGASKSAGAHVGAVSPGLSSVYPDLALDDIDDTPPGLDLVFVSLPHGVSQTLIPGLDAAKVVDLGADYRFDDVALHNSVYRTSHRSPELNESFHLGLVELNRERVTGADRVAVPGCYVTAASLTIAPFLEAGLVETEGIIVDAVSGISGAGREPRPGTTFATVAENFTAYGLIDHRHTPEMEMILSRHAEAPVEILFTPHLAPMTRGILATCYLRPTGAETTDELFKVMVDAYSDEPFVEVVASVPSTKATWGSNSAHLTVRHDQRTGWILALGALDNLVKGAAGQAIQCANLMTGLPETTGLPRAGIFP